MQQAGAEAWLRGAAADIEAGSAGVAAAAGAAWGAEVLAKGGLDGPAFRTALSHVDLHNMVVDIPREW
ncbi:hypothetical protein HaLaN_24230 [Haematococcus lacustris]|uniref:Uncharacterized protein n=1 Tax=Haematococcus lacustris TaxID=44745 RepID=A0A699ZUM5_HAELA|nr:hypothetical protein HaLaN_24230 [Haematococcus lacustris]